MKSFKLTLTTLCLCSGLVALVGARGGCQINTCPDLHIACPDLECPQGFKVDKNACAICECAGDIQPVECETDRDCGEGFACVDGVCTQPTQSCWSDDECPAGLVCDTMNFCDPHPGCDIEGAECPAVCYGRCVEPNNTLYCSSDYDCPEGHVCVFEWDDVADPAPCAEGEDNCGGAEPYFREGVCEQVVCPDYARPDCPDGEIIFPGYDELGCPLPPICAGGCATLDEWACIEAPNCEPIYVGYGCACPGCEEGAECPPCECDPAVVEEFVGCVERVVDDCAQLGERACIDHPACEPIYGGMGVCPACTPDGECPPCYEEEDVFLFCAPAVEPLWCMSDAECPEGMFCDYVDSPETRPCSSEDPDCGGGAIAPIGICMPNQPPPPPPECFSDLDCPEGFFCDYSVYGDVLCDGTGEYCGGGVCMPDDVTRCDADNACAAGEVCIDGLCIPGTEPSCLLEERSCIESNVCEPVYGGSCPECDDVVFLGCRAIQDDCIQVIATAANPETGACYTFATPCEVPEGWGPCVCDAASGVDCG